MEDPNCAPEAAIAATGSPKDVELPRSRWDKSPTPERPVSPEPNCAICLGAFENKSFTNSCMHQFCFVCLLEWSKVKAECPLCKNSFKSIIHNVRGNDDYDQYEVLCPAPPDAPAASANWMSWSLAHIAYSDMQAIPSGVRPSARTRLFRNVAGTSAFRRHIYDADLWARMLPDVTGRYRECSPLFYRQNPAQLHRLVPFLQRELNVLLPTSNNMPEYVDVILTKLRSHRINGREFRTYMRRVVGPRHAAHFCHELLAYASSPFDLIGYDRTIEYLPNNNNNTNHPDLVEMIEDTPSSSSGSDTDDTDDDVQFIARPTAVFNVTNTRHGESTSVQQRSNRRSPISLEPLSPQPGPSGLNSGRVPQIASPLRIDTGDSSVCIVDSSDNDSDECTVVGVVKPRHERTPVVITLSSPDVCSRAPQSPPSGPSSALDLSCKTVLSSVCTVPQPRQSTDTDDQITLTIDPTPSPVLRRRRLADAHKKKARRHRFNSSGSSDFECPTNKLDVPWSSDSEPENDVIRRRKPFRARLTDDSSTRHSHSSPAIGHVTQHGSHSHRSSNIDSRFSSLSSSSKHSRESRLSRHRDSDSPHFQDEGSFASHLMRGHGSYQAHNSHTLKNSKGHLCHRLKSVLHRTSTREGEDIWTVNSSVSKRSPCSHSSESRRSRTESRSRSPPRKHHSSRMAASDDRLSSPEPRDRRRQSPDNSDSCDGSHSKRKRKDSSSKSRKKHHKKSSKSKSKKRKHESSRKDRKKSRHDSDS